MLSVPADGTVCIPDAGIDTHRFRPGIQASAVHGDYCDADSGDDHCHDTEVVAPSGGAGTDNAVILSVLGEDFPQIFKRGRNCSADAFERGCGGFLQITYMLFYMGLSEKINVLSTK